MSQQLRIEDAGGDTKGILQQGDQTDRIGKYTHQRDIGFRYVGGFCCLKCPHALSGTPDPHT
jgi:hypothetical protein